MSWCSFHDHPIRTSPDGTGNGKTIEAAWVRGHPLTLTQAGRTVVLEHALSYVVCAIFVNTSARVDRFHAFVAASIVTAFIDTEAVCIHVAGLMTGSIKFHWTLSLFDYYFAIFAGESCLTATSCVAGIGHTETPILTRSVAYRSFAIIASEIMRTDADRTSISGTAVSVVLAGGCADRSLAMCSSESVWTSTVIIVNWSAAVITV